MNKPVPINHEQERTRQRKAAMLKALKFHLGLVSQSCEMAGVTRSTHYNWMESDGVYAAAVREMDEFQGDFVEGQLLRGIKAGQPAMTIFYAKTKLRHRGYVEKVEVEHTNQPVFMVNEHAEGDVNNVLNTIKNATAKPKID